SKAMLSGMSTPLANIMAAKMPKVKASMKNKRWKESAIDRGVADVYVEERAGRSSYRRATSFLKGNEKRSFFAVQRYILCHFSVVATRCAGFTFGRTAPMSLRSIPAAFQTERHYSRRMHRQHVSKKEQMSNQPSSTEDGVPEKPRQPWGRGSQSHNTKTAKHLKQRTPSSEDTMVFTRQRESRLKHNMPRNFETEVFHMFLFVGQFDIFFKFTGTSGRLKKAFIVPN
ncbi:MAG: hypothetical protein WBG42_05120, partial [Cryomorphaceae bacterium]